MSIKKINPRTLALITFILLIGVVRTYLSVDENMFGLSNFSPVGAMALFGGSYFDKKWKSFFFPLFTLLVSDVVLQFTVFYRPGNGLLYGGWYYVYSAFILMVLVGRYLNKINLLNIFLASIAAVIIHWLVTDFGVWLNNPKYPQSFIGYLQCLVVAIPFEWRFFSGTLIYSAVLFGIFEWMQKKYPGLRLTAPV